MWVTLHALILLSLPIATISAIWRSPTRPKFGIVVGAAIVGALMTFILFPSFISCCAVPAPWRQFFIPTGCALLAIVFIRNSPLSGAMTIVSLISAILLTLQSDRLDGWTRNYNLAAQSAGIARSMRELVVEQIARIPDDKSYPPGWLREHANKDVASAAYVRPLSDSWAEPAWHSWLTGLYRPHGTPQDFWYPGGTLAEANAKIEIRDRPDLLTLMRGQALPGMGRNRAVDELYQANRIGFNDAVTMADFLGEYALAHYGKLPGSINDLLGTGISRLMDGSLVQARTSKSVTDPERFRWRAGAVIDAVPVASDLEGGPASQPDHHLMWDSEGAMPDEVLEQLDARIRWFATH